MSRDGESESTFADVFNGLMGVGPSRNGAGRQTRLEPVRPEAVPLFEDTPREENAASVRAYAWTGGRARTSAQLEIETLVSMTTRAEELMHSMRSEHQYVARLCRQSRSVAEIGALLALPLGVVRVLLDDMAGLGLITVHSPQTTDNGQPEIDLMRRVLQGLTNLRT
jgi:hypothetical protein